MTTAELIKKREEEQNKPLQESQPATSPFGGMNMAEARMAGNNVDQAETFGGKSESQAQPVADADNKPSNNTPLYDAGVKLGSLGNTEKTLKGQSPISTPEYEKFRNEVIGAQLFDVETEEQKKARERRDFIKQGLTGFTEGLSALANLYYTTKGAPSQKQVSQMPELSKRLYAERLERDKNLENFRAWQRAKADKTEERAWQEAFYNKKQEDAIKMAEAKAKNESAEKVAERKFKVLFEGLKHTNKKELANLNDKLRKGQITYQEALKLANKIAYDKTGGRVADSVVSSDGSVLTRNSKLTDNEMKQIVMAYVDDLSPWTKVKEDMYGGKEEKIDYREAFADAAESGLIPTDELIKRGFKQAKSSGNDYDQYEMDDDDEDEDFSDYERK